MNAAEAFMSAASPGVVSLFFRNDHYPDQEAYLFAIAEAMRARIRDRRQCRLRAADRLSRSRAWAGTSSTPTSTSRSSASAPQLHIEALNHALANIPPEQLRMHLCWGNYEGPHHCDVPLADIIDIVFRGAAERDLVRGRQPAPRARMDRCSSA